MPPVNCEIDLTLTCSANCFIIANPINNQQPAFAITDANFNVLVVTLTTQDNAKLLQQLNQVLKDQLTGINVNQKYQYKDQTNICIT